MTELRPELPPMPEKMRGLPVDKRGYPVPWFVQWIDGEPDFRIMDSRKLVAAVNRKLCWVCGGQLGRYRAFVIGPMCMVNRTTSEPPCHLECASYSARSCPFLTRPHAKRREAGMPEQKVHAGVMISRNPGVSVVWVTRSEQWFRVPAEEGINAGVLCQIGPATSVEFWSQGRPATRAEVEASIESGLPRLEELALRDGPSGVALLHDWVEAARALLPAE